MMRDRQPVKVEIFEKNRKHCTYAPRGGERHAGDLPIPTIAPVRVHRVKSTIHQKCEYRVSGDIRAYVLYTRKPCRQQCGASSV